MFIAQNTSNNPSRTNSLENSPKNLKSIKKTPSVFDSSPKNKNADIAIVQSNFLHEVPKQNKTDTKQEDTRSLSPIKRKENIEELMNKT